MSYLVSRKIWNLISEMIFQAQMALLKRVHSYGIRLSEKFLSIHKMIIDEQ